MTSADKVKARYPKACARRYRTHGRVVYYLIWSDRSQGCGTECRRLGEGKTATAAWVDAAKKLPAAPAPAAGPAVLQLNLKGIYFDQIAAGAKPFEFRLVTPFWAKRLVGRSYDFVEVARGYPPGGDTTRRLRFPYRGYEIQQLTHEHFGPEPVTVYAIRVGKD